MGRTPDRGGPARPGFQNGVDQGPLAPEHTHFTQDFIAKNFQSEGRFSAERTAEFIDALRARRGDLQRDAYGTALSERLQRDVFRQTRAEQDAVRQADFVESPVLQGMDHYLLPTAEALAERIHAGAPEAELRGLAEDFVRGWVPYEATTSTIRTHWLRDNQQLQTFFHTVVPHFRKKDDPRALEASNLVVEDENRAAISARLGEEVAPGQYLAPAQLTTLKAKGFDISLINPGVSAFWRRITPEEVDELRAQSESQFPRPEEKLTYEVPRYRSDASTKMTASFVRDGQKHRIKIKLGSEVHPDLLTGRLREYLGFFQDRAQHRDEIRMHLGDKTYDQFEREIGLKYGISHLRRCIARRGTDRATGEEWVVFKDSMIELRPVDEIRAAGLDMGVYDGPNRRELRARHVLHAFFGQTDVQPKNQRLVFRQDSAGAWRPEYRLHDLGFSLGVVTVLRRPRDLLSYPTSKNKIQDYDRKFIRKDGRGNVALTYNDFWRHRRNDATATYADMKWMARLITSTLTRPLIERAVRESGIPESLNAIYCFHIEKMKNRLVDAFDLDGSVENLPGKPPISRARLPDPKSIEDPGAVEKGRIVGKAFPGKIIYPLLQETWLTFINQHLGFAATQTFSRNIAAKLSPKYAVAAGPLFTTQHVLGTTLLDDKVPSGVGKFSLGPGITATVSRVVTVNGGYLFSAEGKARPYLVRDALSVSIGVESTLYREALKWFGAELAPRIQLLRLALEHVHYSETVSAGYTSAPRIQHALWDIDAFAASGLKPGEVLRREWAVGFNAAAAAKFDLPMPGPKLPLLKHGVSAALGWVRSSGVTYQKDTHGALRLNLEEDREGVASASLDVVNVNVGLVHGALLAGHAKATTTSHELWDVEVAPEVYDQENARAALSDLDPKALAAALGRIRQDPRRILDPTESATRSDRIRLKWHLEARQTARHARGQALFVLNRDRTRATTDFRIRSDSTEYELIEETRAKRALAGFEQFALEFGSKNIAVARGTSKKLALEMDRRHPRKFVGIIDVFDYERTSDHAGVVELIDRLNRRYARDPETPFFRPEIPASPSPYRKIYANTRIYVNGEKLLAFIEDLPAGGLEAALGKAFANVRRVDGHGDGLSERVDRRMICRAAVRAGERVSMAVRELGLLSQASHPSLRLGARRGELEEDLARSAFELVDALYKSKYGVSLLKSLLGEDGMAVVGEIFGVHQQTGMLQDDMWKNSLRFTGESWGSISDVPPVSHFVRYEQPMPPNVYGAPRIPIERFLGGVVTGMPGEYIGFAEK